MRIPVVCLLLAAGAGAAEEAQVEWASTWDGAFKAAAERKCPVMVCINSKDGEVANERAAKTTYHDAEFVALSRKLVMVVVSVRTHSPDGICPRFGKVTCKEHGDCYLELRGKHGEQFLLPGGTGDMISPQHAWFRPDGTLLSRREYEMKKGELLDAMTRALGEISGAGGAADAGPQGADAPLSAKDQEELARLKSDDKEARRAALGNLLATGKKAAAAAILEQLGHAPEPLQCDIVRALGRARALDARPILEERLKDKSDKVRSFAAVALEAMAQKESVVALLARVKSERNNDARRNLYRALGACGGPAADKAAAQALLKGVQDKNSIVGKHAALGLRDYQGAGADLVAKTLERLALEIKTPDVRGAIVYALAHLGKKETTLPVFRKLLEDANIDYQKDFYRGAIRVLEGNGDFGEATRFLFFEDRSDPARE